MSSAVLDLTSFSHNVRTPLTGIRGHVELLLGGHCGPLTPMQARSLAAVSFLSHRLESVVEDLVLLAESERDGLGLVLQTIPVEVIVERVTQSLESISAATGVPLTVDVPGEAGTVLGDPRRLERALVNVISNAIKFSTERTPVTVSARHDGDGHAMITVRDQGIGIPAEELAKVFDPEYVASNAIAVGLAGPGLGLAVARTVLTRHDGTISVGAGPTGTTVTMTLPYLPRS